MDIDDMVVISAMTRTVRTRYAELNIEEPAWLDSQLKKLERAIAIKRQDKIERLLHEQRARFETLKSPDEKRAETAIKIAELEKQLAEIK